MKTSLLVALFSAAIPLFSFCSHPVKKGSCRSEITALVQTGAYEKPGGHVYFNVTGFDPQNKDCFNYLRSFGKEAALQCRLPVTIHFLDDMPQFQPPIDGKMYGTEDIRRKVILQYLLLANQQEMVYFDPLGYGKYVEPN